MRITINTPAVDKRLLSLAEARRDASQATARFAQDNASLYELIDLAGLQVARLLDRVPWRERVTVDMGGSGRLHLLGRRHPIEMEPPESVGGANTPPAIEIDGVAVDLDSYRLDGEPPRRFYRELGWPITSTIAGREFTSDPTPLRQENYSVGPMWTGYLMPGQIGDWAASTPYAVGASTNQISSSGSEYARGSWVRPSDYLSNPRRFQCTVAGTSDSSEPAEFADAAIGDEITDGTVTWTCYEPHECPQQLKQLALYELVELAAGPEACESGKNATQAAELRLRKKWELVAELR